MRDAATPRATSWSRVTRARFSASARLYSLVPRASAWPSIRTSVPGWASSQRALESRIRASSARSVGAIEVEVDVAQPGRFVEVLGRGQRREHRGARARGPRRRRSRPPPAPRRARAARGQPARRPRRWPGRRSHPPRRPSWRGSRTPSAPGSGPRRREAIFGSTRRVMAVLLCKAAGECRHRPASHRCNTRAQRDPAPQSLENTGDASAEGPEGPSGGDTDAVWIVSGPPRIVSGRACRLTVRRAPDRLHGQGIAGARNAELRGQRSSAADRLNLTWVMPAQGGSECCAVALPRRASSRPVSSRSPRSRAAGDRPDLASPGAHPLPEAHRPPGGRGGLRRGARQAGRRPDPRDRGLRLRGGRRGAPQPDRRPRVRPPGRLRPRQPRGEGHDRREGPVAREHVVHLADLRPEGVGPQDARGAPRQDDRLRGPRPAPRATSTRWSCSSRRGSSGTRTPRRSSRSSCSPARTTRASRRSSTATSTPSPRSTRRASST